VGGGGKEERQSARQRKTGNLVKVRECLDPAATERRRITCSTQELGKGRVGLQKKLQKNSDNINATGVKRARGAAKKIAANKRGAEPEL